MPARKRGQERARRDRKGLPEKEVWCSVEGESYGYHGYYSPHLNKNGCPKCAAKKEQKR